MRLKGKVAVITGGATGIGGATAQLFGSEGATSIILDYNEKEGHANLARIKKAGGEGEFHQIDVREEAQVKNAFSKIAGKHGKIDTMVISAGILTGAYSTVTELAEQDWNDTIDTNLKGTFLTAKHSAPLLTASASSVLLIIASGAGVFGGSSSYAYAASKAGQSGFYNKLHEDLPNTRTHLVCPGSIATPLKLKNVGQGAETRGEDPEIAMTEARESLGDPMGIAHILTFLASDEADYVRGIIRTR
mgnify:CR=1 FL=1